MPLSVRARLVVAAAKPKEHHAKFLSKLLRLVATPSGALPAYDDLSGGCRSCVPDFVPDFAQDCVEDCVED